MVGWVSQPINVGKPDIDSLGRVVLSVTVRARGERPVKEINPWSVQWHSTT
jgi:hypothetical protein